MKTNLVNIDGELAVLINQAMLEQIGASPETQFKVTVVGKAIRLSPIRGEDREPQSRKHDH